MTQAVPKDLIQARTEIDEIDRKLVTLIAQRQKVVERVVSIKSRNGLPALIPSRVEEVIENAARRASENGMSPDLARSVWRVMVQWFVNFEAEQLKA